jgi:Kdo2-lipid IVA lauroyltransferase/acyltransferase
MKILKYFIEATFIYVFFIIIKLLGLKNSRKLFSFLFNILGPLIKSKNIISKNIKKIHPKITDTQQKNIIENMWSNYGMTFAEYIFLNKFKKENTHISVKGEKNLENIKNKNKPVIFISGHFANFELMAMEIVRRRIDLATIYRPLNNLFLNPFMEFLRRKNVCKNQIKKGLNGVKDAIKFIEKKHSIALMIDQRVSEGEKISFFNEEAFTTTLPAQLALKFNLEIVPVYISRTENNNFEIEFFEPVNMGFKSNKTDLTIKLNQILESMIKKDPSQWILTHNRWK